MVETIEIELTIQLSGHTIQNMEKKQPEGQDIYYTVDPNYKIIAANSILTTITSDGQIKIDFCVESLGIPDRLTFEFGDSKTLVSPIGGETPKQQRRVQCGILLSADQAENIAGLIQQVVKKIKTEQTGPSKS